MTLRVKLEDLREEGKDEIAILEGGTKAKTVGGGHKAEVRMSRRVTVEKRSPGPEDGR